MEPLGLVSIIAAMFMLQNCGASSFWKYIGFALIAVLALVMS